MSRFHSILPDITSLSAQQGNAARSGLFCAGVYFRRRQCSVQCSIFHDALSGGRQAFLGAVWRDGVVYGLGWPTQSHPWEGVSRPSDLERRCMWRTSQSGTPGALPAMAEPAATSRVYSTTAEPGCVLQNQSHDGYVPPRLWGRQRRWLASHGHQQPSRKSQFNMGVYPLSQLHYMKTPLTMCIMFSLGSPVAFKSRQTVCTWLRRAVSHKAYGIYGSFWNEVKRLEPCEARCCHEFLWQSHEAIFKAHCACFDGLKLRLQGEVSILDTRLQIMISDWRHGPWSCKLWSWGPEYGSQWVWWLP